MSRVRFAIAFQLAPISKIMPGRTGTYHPHFYLLLTVRAEYFEPGSPLYISQAERRRMWEQCLPAIGHRIVDIRAAENSDEVAKYVTKPGAYLKLDGDEGGGARSGSRPFTMHSAGGG